MKEPTIIPVKPTFKLENELWVLDIDSIVLPEKIHIAEKTIVSIPPQQFGGNHKHPRIEAFIGLGENLEFLWLDDKKKVHKQPLMQKGKLSLIIVPSYLPHVIVNRSQKTTEVMLEYANEPQHDVEPVQGLL